VTVMVALCATCALLAPGVAGAQALRVVYFARVRASGNLVVTFSGRGVTRGTITWTPPSSGEFEMLSGGSGARRWLRGALDLGGNGAMTSVSIGRGGSSMCTDTAGRAEDVQLPVLAAGPRRLRFALFARHVNDLLFFARRETPTALAFQYMALGPRLDEPAPTHCGGPLPSDFLRGLPSRTLSLRELAKGRMRIDLSGATTFSAAGLTGTVTSTIAVRVAKMRQAPFPFTQPRVPLSREDRALYIHYRIVRVSGAFGVNFRNVSASCAALDACGMTGGVHVQLGPGRGTAEAIVYEPGVTSSQLLRRSIGLAPGAGDGGAQVTVFGSWSHAAGSISETVDRNGAVACRDTARLPVEEFEISNFGARASAVIGGTDMGVFAPNRDLLRTRCPGPIASDLYHGGLAYASFPTRLLGRRTLTLRLTHGTNLSPLGVGPPLPFTFRAQSNVTVVLQRIGVTEELLPDSAFET
jgi:hypothetical protein